MPILKHKIVQQHKLRQGETRSYQHWTKVEDALLRRIWDCWPREAIHSKFASRSWWSIAKHAYILDLHRKGVNTTARFCWPGMSGGRDAYGMTDEEWNEDPAIHHRRMVKKYCQ